MQTVSSSELKAIADNVKWANLPGLPGGRVTDAWTPLIQAALACKDDEWISYAIEEILKGNSRLMAGQRYKPESAVIYSLQSLFSNKQINNKPQPINISDIKPHLRDHYDMTWRNYQIEQMVKQLGFEVTNRHGYFMVQPNEQLLEQLLNKAQTDV